MREKANEGGSSSTLLAPGTTQAVPKMTGAGLKRAASAKSKAPPKAKASIQTVGRKATEGGDYEAHEVQRGQEDEKVRGTHEDHGGHEDELLRGACLDPSHVPLITGKATKVR